MKKYLFLLMAVCFAATAISQNKNHNARSKPKPHRGLEFTDLMVEGKSATTKPKAAVKAKEKVKDKRKDN
jgi:hypothetical protein